MSEKIIIKEIWDVIVSEKITIKEIWDVMPKRFQGVVFGFLLFIINMAMENIIQLVREYCLVYITTTIIYICLIIYLGFITYNWSLQ